VPDVINTEAEPGSTAVSLDPGETVGVDAPRLRPGDFILTHQKDRRWWMPGFALIRLGQALRLPREYAFWNHAALVVDDSGKTIEAFNDGVHYGHVSAYAETEYTAVYLQATDADRAQAVAYAEEYVGSRYGWSVIANITAKLVIGNWWPFIGTNALICSALVAESTRAMGYTYKGYLIRRIMPGELALVHNVSLPVWAQRTKEDKAPS
jgi:hypothetical protein